MNHPRILCFSGSLRKASFNHKLVTVAAQAAKDAGSETTLLRLCDYPLPIFNEDDETASGLPENVLKLKTLFKEHDGLLIASPEYNSSITAALKNLIDWVSRPVPGEPPLACFHHKAAVIMSASPGQLGGLRGLVTLRSILGNIKVVVLPDQVAIPKAHEVFDAEGRIKDPKAAESVAHLGQTLAQFLIRHKRHPA